MLVTVQYLHDYLCGLVSSCQTKLTFSLKVSTIPNTFLIILLFVVFRYTLLTCIFFIKGQQCDNFKILVSFKQIFSPLLESTCFPETNETQVLFNHGNFNSNIDFYREGALGYLFPLLVKLGLLQAVDMTICPHAVNTY